MNGACNATHAMMCAHFGMAPCEARLNQTLDASRLPEWAQGGVSRTDASFLFDLVRAVDPGLILELGVAAGGSTLVMLRTLEAIGRPITDGEGEPAVLAFDLHPFCYCARAKPIGSGMLEAAPALARGVRFTPGAISLDLPSALESASVDLAFIDADHRHPWPTVDLLAILPTLRPGAWVALHDIDLPEIASRHEARTGEAVNWHEHGARLLFNAWPFEKIRSCDDPSNIGALRVDDPATVVRRWGAALHDLLNIPWETDPGKRVRDMLDALRLNEAAA